MSVINSIPLIAAGDDGYRISRSVRLRSSASANFSRTFASAGSQTTWTWSAWLKRGSLSSAQRLFYQGNGSNAETAIYFTGDRLQLEYYNAPTNYYLRTEQVFRDPSAWYHIVVQWNTTDATSSNRMRIWVNGVQVTVFNAAVYPAQNTTSNINSAASHLIGARTGGSEYFDGYLTEINFIDGQALTPSSFGETNTITGVWQPKKYAGTYGTNGFYLNFSDNSSNTSTTIGKDYSGNGNNWTPNNISVTAGSTYDSMLDSPTMGATSSNYAVWNPLDKRSGGSTTYADGNLSSTVGASGSTEEAYATMSFPTSGKWYCEVTVSNIASGNARIGIGNIAVAVDSRAANGYFYQQDGQKYVLGTASAYGSSWTTNDIIGVAFDADAGSITFYKNNTSQGAITGISTTSQWLVGATGKATVLAINFGQRPFSYTPPTGFVALNTQNLPTPTISNGANYMAATLYTGTDGVAGSVTGVGFSPDFVWVKSRSGANSHGLFDTVRGVQKGLFSNLNNAEISSSTYLTSFDSNGFSHGGAGLIANGSLVSWNWKAGVSAVTNTAGTITSTVDAGATQGFSVVTYTGTGANATVGHGLGVAPRMVIVKNRSAGSTNWCVYHVSVGNQYATLLNSSSTPFSNSNYWNNTTPTSTVFSLGNGTDTNGNTNNLVAYCFAEISGYSKFGSYTGNGSSDGPFIFCNFRPRWIMVKRTDSLGSWEIYDSSRSTYNQMENLLEANNSNAEYTSAPGGYSIDFLSNGFKIRGTGGSYNASGGAFVYAAFSESPFKLSLAR